MCLNNKCASHCLSFCVSHLWRNDLDIYILTLNCVFMPMCVCVCAQVSVPGCRCLCEPVHVSVWIMMSLWKQEAVKELQANQQAQLSFHWNASVAKFISNYPTEKKRSVDRHIVGRSGLRQLLRTSWTKSRKKLQQNNNYRHITWETELFFLFMGHKNITTTICDALSLDSTLNKTKM